MEIPQNSYRRQTVWNKAVELAVLIYKLTNNFPKHELYGLASQMQRAAVAIASNIAEGQGRGSKKEFRQFLKIAFGSVLELETQIIISEKIGYLNTTQCEQVLNLCLEIKKMLYRLEGSLKIQS